MIKKRFKEYFNYTKKERNGIIVLLFILLILVIVNAYLNNKSFGEVVLIDDAFQKEVEQFENSLERKKSEIAKQKNAYKKSKKSDNENNLKPKSLFDFDPNIVSKNELKELGLNNKQIKTLLSYRKSGGVFYTPKDLLKIYGIDEKQYSKLEPYIKISNQNDDQKDAIPESIIENLSFIELNSSTKDDLITLPGIGDAFANRIIKYRNLLGGYYKKDQLLNVYGMDTVRFNQFKNQVIIDTNKIIKLNINTAKFEELIRHPHLNKYKTQAILKYRDISGAFSRTEQIIENNLLSEEDYLKLKPYLEIE